MACTRGVPANRSPCSPSTPRPARSADGRVFVWTSGKSVMGFKADTGEPIFSLNLPAAFYHDKLVATSTHVFLVGQDGQVYALDATDKKYEPPM
ncbi:PQQ-binding-like beta-propeller repeat protein [Polyangium sp. y55x31]|uniref:outer membrane protein assembly factor BamB family protein n=1 Tax=Polyangium sp. y55x31 TaxID=3042688 RepID=UPI0032B23C97